MVRLNPYDYSFSHLSLFKMMWSKSIFLKEDPVVPFARPIFPLKEHRMMAAVLPPADISTNKNTVHFITINKR